MPARVSRRACVRMFSANITRWTNTNIWVSASDWRCARWPWNCTAGISGPTPAPEAEPFLLLPYPFWRPPMSKVLIVDDEPAIRQLFQYVFEDEGYEVSTASNGLEALQALAVGAVDLIILDVSMPEMDGRDFVQELTRRAARTPWLAG